MKLATLILFLLCAPLAAQNTTPTIEQATALARSVLMVDGHVDIPYRLRNHWEDISQRTTTGDYDYVRSKEGGLDAPFMSIFVPSEYEDNGAKELADTLITMVEGLARAHPDKFALAYTVDDVRRNFARGVISLPMGMENGSPIDRKLENVKYFADRGIRYITLAHANANHISNAAYDTNRPWKNGLSPFGEQVVAEMNRYGVMVDISHLSDDAAMRVLKITRSPVIASHSCLRAFTPGFERNMSDEVLTSLKKNGGVVMIAYASGFLTKEFNQAENRNRRVVMRYLREKGWKFDDPRAQAYIKEYMAKNPVPYASVADVADHIDYVVRKAGVDHVGLGSDFDGVGDSLPIGLKSVADTPNLILELMKRGYSDADLRKICGENILRVWSQNEQVATSMQKGAK